MDGTDYPAGGPTLEERRALRHSLNAEDREAVEAAVEDLLDFLDRSEIRQILLEFALADESLLYADLERRLDIPSTELAERLQELTERGVLDRTTYDGVSTKVEYRPTETVSPHVWALVPLYTWAIENER